MAPFHPTSARIAGLCGVLWMQVLVTAALGQQTLPTVPTGHQYQITIPTVEPSQLPFITRQTDQPKVEEASAQKKPLVLYPPVSRLIPDRSSRPNVLNQTPRSQTVPRQSAQLNRPYPNTANQAASVPLSGPKTIVIPPSNRSGSHYGNTRTAVSVPQPPPEHRQNSVPLQLQAQAKQVPVSSQMYPAPTHRLASIPTVPARTISWPQQPQNNSGVQSTGDVLGNSGVPSNSGLLGTSGVPSRLAATQLTAQDFSNPIGTSVEREPLQFESIPPPNESSQTLSVPIQGFPDAGATSLPKVENLEISKQAGNPQVVSIFAQGVDLRIVLGHLAQESKVNIVVAESIDETVTTTLQDVPLWEALDAILRINGLVWTRKDNIIYVTKPGSGGAEAPQSGTVPGQVLQVFDLNYTSATEVLTVVNGLLSPSGRAFSHAVDISSTRQTRERIIVEDFPDRIDAIAQYIARIDCPPRQVLIEAHVLQVALDDNQRHGVNLLGLARLAGAEITMQAQGFANAAASPGFMMGVNGTDLDGMIELLESKSDVRTLAAPKVLVVNGQQARIQIGSKFGYFVTTTTQTSTLQSVDFLDIGVVLQVQPTITHDGQVLLTVEPKVSGGRINPDTGLPEEETTEANTTVLLPNGRGMIIGGLIKEDDDHSASWAPWLGEQPIIGKFFSRTNDNVARSEVIIALTPHIVPYSPELDAREYEDYQQATASTMFNNGPVCYPTAAGYPMEGVHQAVSVTQPPNRYSGNENTAPVHQSVHQSAVYQAPAHQTAAQQAPVRQASANQVGPIRKWFSRR